ncbi:MAG: PAS domain S-box protein [Gemmatimonadales bacterium]
MRTKLVFALVAVSLGSMLALGAFTYRSARGLLREDSLEQLEGLAETKKEGLEHIISGWQDRAHLIASRTQLRLSLRDYNRSASPVARDLIERILIDALGSVATVDYLAIYDLEDRLVASASRGPGGEAAAARFRASVSGDAADLGDGVRYQGVAIPAETTLLVGTSVDLVLEGNRLGALQIVLDGREVVDLAGNPQGMGDTGETMILMQEVGGSPFLLHLRYPWPEPPLPLSLDDTADPLARIWAGVEGRYWDDVADYRGEPVWMATRFLPETRWGVIVKFDEAEELARINVFRTELVNLGLSLAAFAILLGAILGFHFSKPVLDLAGVAKRIHAGELDARAEIASQDEIGLFARTFNEMADELERQMKLLREFHTFFDVSLDMMCIAGTDGYFKRVNPAFERTLGWTEEQLVSKPFAEFVHPDDVEATNQEVAKLSLGIPTISFENRYRCADGTYKHLLWTSRPDAETGTLYAIARDISELRQIREQFRLALEASPSAMLMVDPDGMIELLNDAAADLLQYGREALIGQSVEALVPDDVRGRHAELRAEFMRNPAFRPMGKGHEFRARRADGSEIFVEIGLSPVRTDTGVHVLCSIVDLTAHKKARQEIETLARQLEEANARLRETS